MLIMAFGYPFHSIISTLMVGKGIQIGTELIKYSRHDLFVGLLPIMIGGLFGFIINVMAKYDQKISSSNSN